MATEEFKRKLTAVLSADVAGYSRLMGEDDDATVRTLTGHRKMMSSLIAKYQGRVVDSPGDNLLAEFESVLQAVSCAVEIQRELAERNAELPKDRRMEYRIGVNLGDVIQEGDRIYGDGVNIAARLESLAEPGGICISAFVYNQVKNRLKLEYEFMGEQAVKNIKEPVPIYRVLSFPGAAAHRVIKAKKVAEKSWRNRIIIAVSSLVIVFAALAFWHFYLRHPSIEPASEQRMAFPLPDKPSIAVLPFVNMSDDPKQEYFCDGITEEIITALSKNPGLFVIARNSTFSYKDKPVKVQRVSEDLGVRYVLEGSVKKADERIRITAQLIDAMTGNHLWAERYDRVLKDIFAVQDEITIHILKVMQLKVTMGERSREASKPPKKLDAYLKVLEGQHYIDQLNPEDRIRAKKLFEEAIALDPEYAAPYAFLGTCHVMDVMQASSKSPMNSIMEASKLAKKALALDETHPTVHHLLGLLYMGALQFDKAIAAFERAVEINPHDSISLSTLGVSLCATGKPQAAIPICNRALRVDPLEPSHTYVVLGYAYELMKRYEEAISYYEKVLEAKPKYVWAITGITHCYIALGRDEEARGMAVEILSINPNFSVKEYAKTWPPIKDQSAKEPMIAAWLKAGLPE